MCETFGERSRLANVGDPDLYDEERDRDGEDRVREGLYSPGVALLPAASSNLGSFPTPAP